MTSPASNLQSPQPARVLSIQERIDSHINEFITSLPDPGRLSAEQRRGIIARYSAVLEGNFIYWMTAAYLSVQSDLSRVIILENLHEEIRDCHPGMLRRFALAAHAFPTESDAMAVSRDLMNVRLFVGRLSGAPVVLMMAFFEGLIQRFMSFLADLAGLQGSAEKEYTDVHGVCDVAHTQELFRALAAEMALHPVGSEAELFEGVDILQTLLERIVRLDAGRSAASVVAGLPTQ